MQNFEQRRDRFDFFDRMESPAVNLCFRMDLPDFRPWCKEQGLAPFHVLLCAVLRSILKVENFRYRVHEGEVIRIERLHPSFTVVNQHFDLNFAQFDWSDDVREFVARGQAAREEAGNDAGAEPEVPRMSPRDAKDQVFVTCMPWLDFTRSSIRWPRWPRRTSRPWPGENSERPGLPAACSCRSRCRPTTASSTATTSTCWRSRSPPSWRRS
jgi:chloramphenicol O-acetyltransferase type A